VDVKRAERRRREDQPVNEGDAATEFDALDGVVAEETQQRVRSALDRLTPMQREVFTLRVGQGLSYKDIAAITGSTEGAARVHYHHAMRAVKEWIDD
jgi:RNA polymerase sigma-70 factor (ECF subfamily)